MEEETALRNTVKQHGTSSHMHHSVTGFSPSWTKGIDLKHKKLLGESHFHNCSLQKKKEKKSLGHNHVHKKKKWGWGGGVYAVTCGMIRDHPGMLRLVRLHCAAYRFLYSGRAERDPERGWTLLWRQEKMPSWATRHQKKKKK